MNLSIGDGKKFDFKVAGIIENNGRVLLKRSEFDCHWTLPGGNCEFTEQGQDTLAREMMADCQATIDVENVVWLFENFYNSCNKTYHELQMFFKAKLTGESQKLYEMTSFYGSENITSFADDYSLQFRWFDKESIEDIEIEPSFLKKRLFSLPEGFERVVSDQLV